MKENSYFNWLLDIVEHEKQEKTYFLMLGELYRFNFYAKKAISMDNNRAADGISLRNEYFMDCQEEGYEQLDVEIKGEKGDPGEKGDKEKDTCSVLEMIIGISKRMNDELMTEKGDDNTAKYFWEIIENLGLLKFNDERFGESNITTSLMIRDICRKLCDRKYKPDGTNGGMFPMFGNTRINQKRTEIWFQMQEYINWKYGIGE